MQEPAGAVLGEPARRRSQPGAHGVVESVALPVEPCGLIADVALRVALVAGDEDAPLHRDAAARADGGAERAGG
jgi:hypothetical protein